MVDRIALGVAALLLVGVGLVVSAGLPEAQVAAPVPLADLEAPKPEVPAFPAAPADREVDGLRYAVLQDGEGDPPEPGSEVLLHVTVWEEDGTLLRSTVGTGPVRVRVGVGEVLPVVDRMAGAMRVGERRKVLVPVEEERVRVMQLERLPIQ